MQRRSKKIDPLQLTLGELLDTSRPAPPEQSENAAPNGSLNFDNELRCALAGALKDCPLDRHEVAARMSRLTGEDITKHSLDAWTGASRKPWRFPLAYLPALIEVTGAYSLLDQTAAKNGCKVLAGDDVVLAEYGRLAQLGRTIERARSQLEKRMPGLLENQK